METSTSHDQKQARESASCCLPGTLDLPLDEVLADTAATLKSIAHPVRLKILNILRQAGEAVCVCDLEAYFTLSQPTISHHLRLLREAGLVEGDQRGPWVYYSVRKRPLADIGRTVSELGA